jgi:hypothetical protein
MITAEIKPDTDGKGLWLFINNGEESSAWPIMDEEVRPILEACYKYLKGRQND